jgi:hypothetical protein
MDPDTPFNGLGYRSLGFMGVAFADFGTNFAVALKGTIVEVSPLDQAPPGLTLAKGIILDLVGMALFLPVAFAAIL